MSGFSLFVFLDFELYFEEGISHLMDAMFVVDLFLLGLTVNFLVTRRKGQPML